MFIVENSNMWIFLVTLSENGSKKTPNVLQNLFFVDDVGYFSTSKAENHIKLKVSSYFVDVNQWDS